MKTSPYDSRCAALRNGMALAAALFLTLPGTIKATTIGATSMAQSDVAAAVALAHDGDTVMVPAGTISWTNFLYVTNAITLQFAGVGKSIILDDISNNLGGNPSYTESVISLFPVNTNVLARITGLQINKGLNPRAIGVFEKGALQTGGNTCMARIDHCLFTNVNNDNIYVYNASCPCIDHCTFYIDQANMHFVCVEHDSWAGGKFGDGAWQSPAPLGTSNSAYIEDCNFTGWGPGTSFCAVDAFNGAHYVFRYNHITNTWISCHGTDSSMEYRGTRSIEVYGNTAFNPNWNYFMEWRSGTGVMWSNTTSGYGAFSVLSHYRSSTSYQCWGGLFGTNSLDHNPPENANGPSLTVTAAAGSTTQTLVVTNSLPVNGYLGWSAIDQNFYPKATFFGGVYSNTANTFYFLSTGDGQPAVVFTPGDTVLFYKPALCGVDMTGTGQSGVMNRYASGPNAGSPTGQWPTNMVEPIYSWGNTLNGADAGLTAQNKIIVANVHYFNDTPKPGYVPFTYPHPLTFVGTALEAPTNLRVVQ